MEVLDSGPGISEEDRAELFKPYGGASTTYDPARPSTGLGLALCHKLVKAMGGNIGVEPAPEGGARFWFEVPAPGCAPDGDERDASKPAPIAAEPSRTPIRVLVVEDTPVNQEVARHMLERLGHTATVVDDGEQALTAVMDNKSFCCILMDWQLPGISGLDATRVLRDRGITTPIIGVSAHASPADHDQALASGMDAFLTKPVRLAALRKVLEAVQPTSAEGLPTG